MNASVTPDTLGLHVLLPLQNVSNSQQPWEVSKASINLHLRDEDMMLVSHSTGHHMELSLS